MKKNPNKKLEIIKKKRKFPTKKSFKNSKKKVEKKIQENFDQKKVEKIHQKLQFRTFKLSKTAAKRHIFLLVFQKKNCKFLKKNEIFR